MLHVAWCFRAARCFHEKTAFACGRRGLLVLHCCAVRRRPGDPARPAPRAADGETAGAPEPIPANPGYRQKGEQYRVYSFPGTGESIPYRLFVPSRWTPDTKLPMLVTLRAGNSVDNSYRDNNDLVKQAEQRGYLIVTPLGYRGLSQPYTAAPIRSSGRRDRPSRPPAGRRRRTSAASRTSSTSSISSRRSTTSIRRASRFTARTRRAPARSTWSPSTPRSSLRRSSAPGPFRRSRIRGTRSKARSR